MSFPRPTGEASKQAFVLLSVFIWTLVGFPAGVAAQDLRWRWSNPTPHGGNVRDMTMTSGITVQVAERGQVYTSEDLSTWIPRASGTTNALRAATFFGSRLLVTGESGTVLYADSPDDFRLVNLGTADWLEGVAASSTLAVAVGDNGAVYTSNNGENWKRQSVPFNNWLRGVAYSPALDVFVTVGEGGLVATSPNGTDWTVRPSGTTKNLNRVSWLSTRFFIVGEGGTVLNSGSMLSTTYTAISFPTTNTLYALADDLLTARFVFGDQEVRRRESQSWYDETSTTKSDPAPKWTYYSAQYTGSSCLTAGRSGLMIEGTRPTVLSPWSWIERFRPIRTWLWDMTRAPSFYIAVGDRGVIMTSDNGVAWDLELPPPEITTNSVFLGVCASSNMVVAVGAKGTIARSPDTKVELLSTNSSGVITTNLASAMGVLWQSGLSRITNDLQGITFWQNRWIASGTGGALLASNDATNWVSLSSGVSSYLSSIAGFPGGLVAVGRGGTLITSPDGNVWTSRNVGTTNWIYRVRDIEGTLVAVGEAGVILTSSDGTTWTRRLSGTTRWLTDVSKVGNAYYVCGHQGAVLSSTDLVSWSYIGCSTEKSLFTLASADGRLIVAGVEGAILRVQVVPNLSPVQFLNFDRVATENIYLIGGKTGQRFTLDASATLTDWATGPAYELLDPDGTLMILQDTGTNSPPSGFYRATVVP